MVDIDVGEGSKEYGTSQLSLIVDIPDSVSFRSQTLATTTGSR